jgi:hypothetical protein
MAVAAPAECRLNGEQRKQKKCDREASKGGDAHEESIAIGGKKQMKWTDGCGERGFIEVLRLRLTRYNRVRLRSG